MKNNIFTEEVNKIALSSNDDKKMQSIHSIEVYASVQRFSFEEKSIYM